MRYSLVFGLCAALASMPAAAEPEPEDLLVPAVYAGLGFGGASGVRDARLGLRLDAAAPTAGAPALMQWELRPGVAEFSVAGLALVSRAWAAGSTEPATIPPPAAGSGISYGLLATAAGLAATGWLLSNLEDDVEESVGQAVEDGAVNFFTGPYQEDDAPESDPSACSGVEVGDDCVGG